MDFRSIQYGKAKGKLTGKIKFWIYYYSIFHIKGRQNIMDPLFSKSDSIKDSNTLAFYYKKENKKEKYYYFL
jgi:hypothetical protein